VKERHLIVVDESEIAAAVGEYLVGRGWVEHGEIRVEFRASGPIEDLSLYAECERLSSAHGPLSSGNNSASAELHRRRI
jgi:hypothetical protein